MSCKRRVFFFIFLMAISVIAACQRTENVDKVLSEYEVETFNLESRDCSFDDYFNSFVKAYSECNYGLAYGLVHYICKHEKLCDVNVPTTDVIEEDSLFLLDITKPLFDGVGIGNREAEQVKAISVDIAEYIVKEYGLKALIDTTFNGSYAEVEKLKNEWLHSMGYDCQYSSIASFMIYDNKEENNDQYPYYAKSDSYLMFFNIEDIENLGYIEFFGEYGRIQHMIEEDFKDARKEYWKCSNDTEPVQIYTCFCDDATYNDAKVAGLYSYKENHINVYSDWPTAEASLLHEYIHFLDKDFFNEPETNMPKKRAMLEACASEVATYECENRLLKDGILQKIGKDELTKRGILKNGEVDAVTYSEMYSKYLISESGEEVIDANGNKQGISSEVIPWYYLPGQVNGSFLHYAMEYYGKEDVIETTYHTNDFDNLISSDYENVYHEWITYLDNY